MKKFGWIFFLIVFIAFGVLLGLILTYLESFEVGKLNSIVAIILLIPYLIIFFIINIIIHELGHLVFGLMTGYNFFSFRVFSFIWYRGEDNKIHKGKSKTPGIAGQCLMTYDKPYNDKMPLFWYNSGGGIFNIIIYALSMVIMYFNLDNYYIIIYTVVSAFISLSLGLSNLFPVMDCNDGANMWSVRRNSDCHKSVYDQLRVNASLTRGQRMVDIELLNYDFNSMRPMAISAYLLTYYKFLYAGNIDKAKEIIDYFETNLKDVPKPLKLAVVSEIIVFKALYEKEYDCINDLVNELPKAVKRAFPTIKEISMTLGYVVYVTYGLKDYEKALKALELEEKLINRHYYEGIKEDMLNQLAMIRNDLNDFMRPKEEISTNDEEIS